MEKDMMYWHKIERLHIEKTVAVQTIRAELQKPHPSLEAIGEVAGKVETEELLGEIFGSFCIGK